MRPPSPLQVVLSVLVVIVAVPFIFLVLAGGDFRNLWDVAFNGFVVVIVVLASAGLLYMINRQEREEIQEELEDW